MAREVKVSVLSAGVTGEISWDAERGSLEVWRKLRRLAGEIIQGPTCKRRTGKAARGESQPTADLGGFGEEHEKREGSKSVSDPEVGEQGMTGGTWHTADVA